MTDINAHDAAWVLVASGGPGGDVVRFSRDLAYVYEAICAAGVAAGQIRILIDNPMMGLVLAREGVPQAATAPVTQAAVTFSALTTSGFVGVVVSGHGNHQAIATQEPIRSTEMLRWMASVPGATTGALVLGQCYAGVFRYVDARTPPPIAVMGATNFEASFSMTNVPRRRSAIDDWLANPFLVNFADWLAAPVDVDGDGVCTLLDAYRHASVKTMERLHHARVIGAVRFKEDVLEKRAAFDAEGDPAKKAALGGELETAVSILFGRPEPWIMGADEARLQVRR